MRLDKFLSNAGFGSRKEVKELIKQRRVQINDTTAKSPSQKVNPETDTVFVDEEPVVYKEHYYYMLNKPAGYLSATEDKYRPTVLDFFVGMPAFEKLFPVGRLDIDTEGLLIITTDGQLAHRLSHPKWNIEKEYYAIVEGDVSNIDFSKFEKEGLFLKKQNYKTKPFKVKVLRTTPEKSEIQITLTEGKYHIVKNIMEQLVHPVQYLKRTKIADLKLDENLKPGEFRELTEEEVKNLKKLVNLSDD